MYKIEKKILFNKYENNILNDVDSITIKIAKQQTSYKHNAIRNWRTG